MPRSPAPGRHTPRFRYTGAIRASGELYHNGLRFYDPINGRWTQADPLDQPGSAHQGNRFAYVGDDPINLADPAGTSIIDDVGGAISDAANFVGRNAATLYEIGETSAYTLTTGALAIGGTATCVGATAGVASAACAGIFLTAGTASAGGVVALSQEAKELR